MDMSEALTGERIKHLCRGDVGSFMDLPKKSWYSRILYLGEHLGVPMLTFTCPEGFLDDHLYNAPTRAYASTIIAGLVEALNMDPSAIVQYILHATVLHYSRKKAGTEKAGKHSSPQWLEADGGIPELAKVVGEWLVPGSSHDACVRAWAWSAEKR